MGASTQGDLFGFNTPAPPAPVVEEARVPAAPVPAGPPLLTLFDASGFIFRAYHALPPLTTSHGVPTHAVLGFARMVLKTLREDDPQWVALCFDKDSRRGRLAIDPNYKANRTATPDDLLSQFALIRKVAEVLALPVIEFEGWEADDVIGTLCARAEREGFRVRVLTSDKDFIQLLAPHVELYDPMKLKDITAADALEKYGVKPEQMRDYLALVGDAIDNVPKVPGIGPKTAVDLLNKFGSVPNLVAHVDEVEKPKVKEALKANHEQLMRAYELVGFKTDLPLDVPLEALKRRDIHQAEARALFTELEFYRLIAEMPQPPAPPLAQKVTRVVDAAGLPELVAAISKFPEISFAPASEGAAHSAVPVGLAIRVGSGDCFFVADSVDRAALSEQLGAALKTPGLKWGAHDAKATLHALRAFGVAAPVPHTDVELISYLLNPSRKEHALTDLARERLRVELPVLPAGPKGVSALQAASLDVRAQVFAAHADAVGRLSDLLWAEADGVGLGPLARELEMPLVPVLAKLEERGIRVDLDALKEISVHVDAQVNALLKDVYVLAGREFNVGSPAQLAQVLFDDLKLPVLKKTRTGPSTEHEVLEKLAEQHPLPQSIIEYRTVAKLKNTYLDTLPLQVNADGRIRTTFHQAAAATGRLSSVDPNLQNIPIRSELGKQIRRGFVADPGWLLVSADYSQIELRILAHIAGDEGLVTAFRENADVHARTAAEVFGIPLAEVTSDMRRVAKMVNYGIAYGLSAHGLSTRLRMPVEEAKAIIDRYFVRYAGISRYLTETIEKARKTGYVESLFGRRRYLPDLVSRNRNVSNAAERAAINMPIQATAADLIKKAMLKLELKMPARGLKARMLLQVHDELLFEAPEEEADRVADVAREVMMGVASFNVPLVVDIGRGKSWAAAH